ncbi:MAG: hypothetical protein U0166_14910 [Acidobacteriota bacterium]
MTQRKLRTWIFAATTLVGAAIASRAQETSITDPSTANSPKGKITIVNETGTPVTVMLGEAKLGTVSPKGRQEYKEIPPENPKDPKAVSVALTTGLRIFTASNAGGDRYWGPKDIQVQEAGSEWKISETAKGGVHIANYTDAPIQIMIGDKVMATAPAGKDATFADMKDGRYRFSGKSADGKKQYSQRYYEVKAGAALIEWKIGTPPAAAAPATPAADSK